MTTQPVGKNCAMTTIRTESLPLKVYWQPGCSSCLKTKEFLLANNQDFVSVNVLEDENGFRELEALGLRLVPIVVRGSDWANGAVFRDVAQVAGFAYGEQKMLAPGEMMTRLDGILGAVVRYTAQIPEDRLDAMLPGRPRSYRQLAYHVMNIPDVFLDRVEYDAPYTYEALLSILPDDLVTRDDLVAYGHAVRARLWAWWECDGKTTDFNQPGKVYYGDVTLHEVLERTCWHSGQHVRQLMLVLGFLGTEPDGPLTDDDFAGLPMPKEVWDNELSFGAGTA